MVTSLCIFSSSNFRDDGTSHAIRAYGGKRLRRETRTSANANPVALLSPQSLPTIALRPVVGRSNLASGPGNAPPIHPSCLAFCEDVLEDTRDESDEVVVASASNDATRAASASERARSLMAWPKRAGTPMPTSCSTVRDATSTAVSNQFARRVWTIFKASFSPRPTRTHTRMANASRVSTSAGSVVVLVSSAATSDSAGPSATTREGLPRHGPTPRKRGTRRHEETPAPGPAANATRVAIGRGRAREAFEWEVVKKCLMKSNIYRFVSATYMYVRAPVAVQSSSSPSSSAY